MTAWEVTLPGASWLELPVNGRAEDALAWARKSAAELLPADAPADLADALAAELEVHARYARRLDAVLAAVLILEPAAGVLAVLFVRDVPAVDLDELERELRSAQPDDLTPPEVRQMRLPAGPACRVRRLVTVPARGAEQVLSGSVAYYVLGDDGVTAAELHLEWLAVAVGEGLAELADEVAAGLVLPRPWPPGPTDA